MFARTDSPAPTASPRARPRRVAPPLAGWPRPEAEAFAERLAELLLRLENAPAAGFTVRAFADLDPAPGARAHPRVGLRLPTGAWSLDYDQAWTLAAALRAERAFAGAEAVAAAVEDAAAEAAELAATLNMDLPLAVAGHARTYARTSARPAQSPPAYGLDPAPADPGDDDPTRLARWALAFLVFGALAAGFLVSCLEAGAANGVGAG